MTDLAIGARVIYMKPHPWNAGGWWTDHPATVLGFTPTGRIRIMLDIGRKCAVKRTSVRPAPLNKAAPHE